MATKKNAGKKPAQPKAKAKATKGKQATSKKPRAKAAPSEKRLGCLGAAVRVLTEAREPMTCKDITEAALAKGYWESDGKTPSQTLAAAIIREIATKGKESRFIRTERGKFALGR